MPLIHNPALFLKQQKSEIKITITSEYNKEMDDLYIARLGGGGGGGGGWFVGDLSFILESNSTLCQFYPASFIIFQSSTNRIVDDKSNIKCTKQSLK
jgi:hypothetical protein